MESEFQNHIGVMLFDPVKQKTLFHHKADKYYTPASNTKILTLYTALNVLGDSLPAFKYVVAGDSLLLWGMADPSFLNPAVHQNPNVYRFLQQENRKLFLSQRSHYTTALGRGWAWDDYNDYYSVERSPFPIYGNVIDIELLPDGRQIFQPAFFARHALTAEADGDGASTVVRDEGSNQLIVYKGDEAEPRTFIIPFRYSADLVSELLADTLNMPVEELELPPPPEATMYYSIPADSAYKVMMQESDNFIAEELLLACAAILSDTLKPEVAIDYARKKLLADLPDAVSWVDGSGLSRYNLMTPRSVVRLWEKLYATVPQQRLWPLLATGGVNGTLKNYFKSATPYIFGKTGTLNNNNCLSGFVVTKKQRVLIFSFMSNNFVVSVRQVRLQLENLLQYIHERY